MSKNQELFENYLYHRLCEGFEIKGREKSLNDLYTMSNITADNFKDLPREQCIIKLLNNIPPAYREKIALTERAMTNRYKIDGDCQDDDLMFQVKADLYKVLSFITGNSEKNIKSRIAVYNHLYNIDEQQSPTYWENRFIFCKKMVQSVKNNQDGRFDHNPLNITARRMDYFMKSIDVNKRYALLSAIDKKTCNHDTYNYSEKLSTLQQQCENKQEQDKLWQLEAKRLRYEEIREYDLPQAPDAETQIKLYEELLTLVNSQDISRGRKFNEKKTIYNHLIALYKQTGNLEGEKQARMGYEKFLNARNICREATRIKGYKTGRGY